MNIVIKFVIVYAYVKVVCLFFGGNYRLVPYVKKKMGNTKNCFVKIIAFVSKNIYYVEYCKENHNLLFKTLVVAKFSFKRTTFGGLIFTPSKRVSSNSCF